MRKIVIDADKNNPDLRLTEIFQYKDLFLLLTYRDFKVKYAQTYIGIFWAFIKPIVTLLILVLVFQKAINVKTGETPYIAFVLSGLPFWIYFSSVVSNSGGALISAQQMIKKIYFPRIILPLSKAAIGIPDTIIAFLFFIAALVYYQIDINLNLVYLPLLFLLVLMFTIGLGIWISALSVRYRDIQHILPFSIQILFYFTPIAYPSSLISEKYQFLFDLNPLKGIIDCLRWAVFSGDFPITSFLFSLIISFILFITSLMFFKRIEKTIADII